MGPSPLWRVDATGNVRPWRPRSSVQPAAPSPSPSPAPFPSVSAARRSLLFRPLTLPASSDVDPQQVAALDRRYPGPIDVSSSLAFASPADANYNRFSFDSCYALAQAAFAPEISPSSTVATPASSALAVIRSGRKQHESLKKQTKKAVISPPTAIAPKALSSSSSTAASSTERGRKFRKRLQEREVQARADIELLRQQILRIQALKRSGQQQALFTHHRDLCRMIAESNATALATTIPQLRVETQLGAVADGGSALRFVREYFALFRYGVLDPNSNSHGTATEVALDSSRHEAFLSQWAVPDVKFDEFVGTTPMIDQWRRYSSVHSFIKLDPVSMEVQVVDGLATVVAKGVLHIRYSRRTLESVFPRLLGEQPELADRLIGRLVHMHYTSHYFFDERSRLMNQQIVPDFVSALKEVLGSLDDVAKVLDCALLKEHVLGEIDYDRYEEQRAAETTEPDDRQSAMVNDADHNAQLGHEGRRSPTSGSGMDIQFLLS